MLADELDRRLFLTCKEFAEVSRSDPRTVRSGIKAGHIPAVRFSGTMRIPATWVRAVLGYPEGRSHRFTPGQDGGAEAVADGADAA